MQFLIPQIKPNPFPGREKRASALAASPEVSRRIWQSRLGGWGAGLGAPGASPPPQLRSEPVLISSQSRVPPHHPAMPWCFLDTKTEHRKDVNINQALTRLPLAPRSGG